MDAIGWFVVAFVAQSVGVVILWVQVLRNDSYSRSMGAFLETFAMSTVSHIKDIQSLVETSTPEQEEEQVNRNPIGFRV